MKGFRPPRPTGSSPKARFDTWVYDTLVRLNFIDSATVKFNRRTNGVSADAVVKASVGGAGVNIDYFTITAMYGDYFLGDDGTAIAKPYKCRCSIKQEIIYGTTVNYSYPHNPVGGGPAPLDPKAYLYRVATIGSGSTALSENEGIVPQYLLNADTIYAIQMPNGTGVMSDPLDTQTSPGGKPVEIQWIQISTAQAWTKFKNQNF